LTLPARPRHHAHRRRARSDRNVAVPAGDAGVFLLDSKNLLGRAAIDDGALVVTRHEARGDSYRFDRLDAFMRRSAAELSRLIGAQTRRRHWVTPVVVVWPELEGRVVEADGVVYVSGDHLADWLSSQPAKDASVTAAVAPIIRDLADAKP
jgi:hypothetical protein